METPFIVIVGGGSFSILQFIRPCRTSIRAASHGDTGYRVDPCISIIIILQPVFIGE